MPSPVGHALGGAIVASALGTIGAAGTLGTVVLAAVAPDIDLLWGRHDMETHSLGAAILAGLIVLAWKRSPRLAIAVTLAWCTHILFDWLGSDDTPPLGVMALWPLNSKFYFANAFVFDAISRRYWLDNFIAHNVWAVIKEVVMLAPLALAVRIWRLKNP